MKRFLLSFFTVLSLFSAVYAEIEYIQPPLLFEQEIIPIISVDEFVPLGEKILFDASNSDFRGISEGTPSIHWDFGDRTDTKWGKKVYHEFKKTGKYTVRLSIKQGRERKSIDKDIFVYSKKGTLITRKNQESKSLISQAGRNGMWLKPIFREISEAGITADEELIEKLQNNQEFIRNSELIIFNTPTADEIQNVAQWWQKIEEDRFDPKQKSWVQIVEEGSLKKMRKLLFPSFSILNPNEIYITRIKSLFIFFEQDYAKFRSQLESRGLEHEILDAQSNTTWLLPISKLTNYFIFRGISRTVIYLLLAVPFIVFVIAFARQFVGIKTFGVFSPLMLTLSFMLLGLKFGFTVFFVVLMVSSLIRRFFEKVELLYIPKIALLHSGIALSFFLILGIAVYFDVPLNLALAIFPMMVMSTISEKFIAAQSSGGSKSAMIAAGETVLVSFIAYLLVVWPFMQESILATPELIFIPVMGNIWLGKFTGLRLTEYFKFRALFTQDSQE